MILEVIVQSVADAEAAAAGGADRLELVRAIDRDGLTPSLDLVRRIHADTSLPLRVMLRENAGFATDAGELHTLRRAASEFAALGVDGLVLGFTSDGEPRLSDVARVLEAAPGARATFHRAFDFVRDQFAAIDALARIPQIDSILTSGGDGRPAERCARLRQLADHAGGRLRIVAGGRVDEAMFAEAARTRCIDEVHVGRLARDGGNRMAPVSAARVRALRAIAGAAP